MNRVVVLCALCLALTGCAFTPQGITLTPKVEVAPSEIGKGKELPLNVVDERSKKTLGTVGARNIGADITINGDIVVSVQKAISEGLSRMNFKPTTDRNGMKNELRVEIRNLDYTVIVGFWAGTLRVDAALKGICLRDGLRPYEKLHHGEFVESVQVVQSQEANTEYINQALSTAVNALLSDKELIACLAGQGK